MPTHLSQKSVINPPIKTLQLFPQKEKHPSDYKIQHSYIVQLKKSQTNTQTNNNIVQIERKKNMEGSQTSQGSVHPHPYVPKDLHLPGYVPCFLSQSNILSVYASFFVILFALTWIFSGKYTKIQLNLRFFQ